VTMRGVVFDGQRVEVRTDLEVRSPAPDEVAVRIAAAGVCHSDVSVTNGTIPFPTPVVLGHEGAGVVEAVGSAVTSVHPGDHVVISTLASCGHCRWCNTGHPTWCRSTLGNFTQPFTVGGQPAWNFAAASTFAEVTVIKEIQAVPVPADIPMAVAAIVACAVVTGAGAVLNRASVTLGQSAAVFGVGGVGLSAIAALRLAGASRIIALDTVAAKEGLARSMGATDFVDATGDTTAAVRALLPYDADSIEGPFGAGGVDWSFDCVGLPATLRSAVDILDWGGTCVAIGVPPAGAEVSLPISRLLQVDRGLLGTRAGGNRPHADIPLFLDLYRQGRLDLDAMVTRVAPVEEFHDVVQDMEHGRLARGVLRFN
jgi:Zn-dependent alcohol dehydrogenase